MIVYKISIWNKINRLPRTKCKRIKGLVIVCVGELNCEYIKKQNKIIKKQFKK